MAASKTVISKRMRASSHYDDEKSAVQASLEKNDITIVESFLRINNNGTFTADEVECSKILQVAIDQENNYVITASLRSCPYHKLILHVRNFDFTEHRFKNVAWPPLHYAVYARKNGAISAILESGVSVNAPDLSGLPPLIVACENCLVGHSTVQQLIDAGANVNLADQSERTALHVSARIGRPEIRVVELLLDHGADVNATDDAGLSPLSTLIKFNRNPFSAPMLSLLLKAGADVNSQDSVGCTALFHCLSVGGINQKRTIQVLLNGGASVNIADNEGKTVLMVASFQGVLSYNRAIISMFLDHGADLNAQDKSGNTCLHYAALQGDANIGTILFLLSTGAKVIPNNKGQTFMDKLSIDSYLTVLPQVIELGITPSQFSRKDLRLIDCKGCTELPVVTALSLALVSEKTDVALNLLDKCFLTPGDVRHLPVNLKFRQHLMTLCLRESVQVYDDYLSAPLPLMFMCFVRVSSLIGAGISREERILSLGLPEKFQRALLFKTKV